MIYNKKENKFIISIKIREFIDNLKAIYINLPNKEVILKNNIINDSYKLLELIYIANYTKDNNKKTDYKVQILAKISMIDYYLEVCYKNRYISERQLKSLCNKLLIITKMIYKWISDEC